jgi:hypothetical protein
LIKVSRRLDLGCRNRGGSPDMVAHATGTYALPPASGVR